MEERFERQARNEGVMRTVNDRIAALDKRANSWADDRYAIVDKRDEVESLVE